MTVPANSFDEQEWSPMTWITLPVRFSRLMFAGMLAASGMFGYSLGNGHTTQGAIEHVSNQLGQKSAELHKLNTVVIPQLKAATHCEAARGDKAVAVAHQAIRGALVDAAPIPSPSAIPADNCVHPAATK